MSMTEHPALPIPHPPLASLARRCRPVALLVLDVDGVLTDGAIVYGILIAGAARPERAAAG